jgi:hypothetical protein
MTAFQNAPFQQPILLMKGVASYLIGSFDYKVGNTQFVLSNSALTTNVATITVAWLSGPLPKVGDLISIQNSTAGSAALNVNRAIITGGTALTASNNGNGTITFALTNANITSVADSGTVITEPAEVGESVTTSYTSRACLIPAPEGDSQFTVAMSVTGGASITAMTATLQKALKEQSNEWTNTTTVVTKTGASTYSAGPVVEATLERAYLYRIAVTSVTGTDLVTAKIGG